MFLLVAESQLISCYPPWVSGSSLTPVPMATESSNTPFIFWTRFMALTMPLDEMQTGERYVLITLKGSRAPSLVSIFLQDAP